MNKSQRREREKFGVSRFNVHRGEARIAEYGWVDQQCPESLQ